MSPLYEHPVEILQRLIRFDTTNPPGNEVECIRYLDGLLTEAGFQTTLLAKDPKRPNMIARLAGRGAAPGLVLQGHVDVVTTAGQRWSHPPFGGDLIDGEVWGRGSLDMKGAVAMMAAAFLRAKAEGLVPAGEVVLTIMSDEEAGSDYGARFLTENHPEQFAGVAYALGEGGGDSETLLGQRYYPVSVAEKEVCWLRGRLHGPGGHGSQPMRGGAMAKLGRLLMTLDGSRLPVHVTPVMERMLDTLIRTAPHPLPDQLSDLLDPTRTDAVLDALLAAGVPQARGLDALLHNTVNVTVVHGGFKTNVVPSTIDLELDGRLLPGFTPDDLLAELRALVGDDLELDILRHDPGRHAPDFGLLPLFAELVAEFEPEAVLLPTLVGGFTDGRMFGRLGIQNYGFLPLPLPPDLDLMPTVHGADERVSAAAIEQGARMLYRLLERYPGDLRSAPI